MRLGAVVASFAFAAILFALPLNARSQQAPTGCKANPQTPPEIAGTYVDDFGGLQAISGAFWISGASVFEICSVDNAKHRLIAFNNARNAYNPGKFSAFDWARQGNKLWYCQVIFDAASEGAAAAAPPANPQMPATAGCGQFAWSTLIRLLP